jgi:hypothetical protein
MTTISNFMKRHFTEFRGNDKRGGKRTFAHLVGGLRFVVEGDHAQRLAFVQHRLESRAQDPGGIIVTTQVWTTGNAVLDLRQAKRLFPLVASGGILGGSMPRSGGEYIYNSRIIHPLIGIAESFGNAFVWIMWIYVLAPWTVDPGLTMMFQFLGRPDIAELS